MLWLPAPHRVRARARVVVALRAVLLVRQRPVLLVRQRALRQLRTPAVGVAEDRREQRRREHVACTADALHADARRGERAMRRAEDALDLADAEAVAPDVVARRDGVLHEEGVVREARVRPHGQRRRCGVAHGGGHCRR